MWLEFGGWVTVQPLAAPWLSAVGGIVGHILESDCPCWIPPHLAIVAVVQGNPSQKKTIKLQKLISSKMKHPGGPPMKLA